MYPNGATCLSVDWRKNKHWLSRNQDSVFEWSDMSTGGLKEEQTLVVSESGYSVSEWSDMSTSGLEEEQTLVVSESGYSVSEWSDISTSELLF